MDYMWWRGVLGLGRTFGVPVRAMFREFELIIYDERKYYLPYTFSNYGECLADVASQ